MLKIKDNVDLKELDNFELKRAKTAKEMFEELGYELSKYDSKIEYDYLHCFCGEYRTISFYLNSKKIKVSTTVDEEFDLNIQELKAINKQVEELEWNE